MQNCWLAKEKDLKKSIDILQERNQQLCKNPVASQAHYHSSPLPREEWYYIHGSLEKTLQWFQQTVEDAESLDIKLPKKQRDYRELFKQMEGIIRTLKEHEASQPPEKEFRNIGEHGFDIEKHGSKLLQPMKEALEDPKRVRLFDILPQRSGLDKTGLGASSMQGVGSASSSFV